MAGITAEGLVIKRLSDLLTERRQLAVSLFQDLVAPGEVVDTSDSSALGRLISLAIPSQADLWEALQEVYTSQTVSGATDKSLDDLVELGGLRRYKNTHSVAQALFRGNRGTLIPANSVVTSSVSGEQFNVVSSVALSPTLASGITVTVLSVENSTAYKISYTVSGVKHVVNYTSVASATAANILSGIRSVIVASHPSLIATVVGSTLVIDLVDIYQTSNFGVTSNLGITKVAKIGDLIAQNYGPIEQEANTITSITTPVLGWDSVTNPTAAIAGRYKETDEELRERFRNTHFDKATNILEALYSALIGIDSVEQVIIYENDTDETDIDGIPSHSFMPIVLGGTSDKIANAIWQNKPIGISSYGNTTVNVYDSQGFPHEIGFERPSPVNIYIDLEITTDTTYPQDGDDQIKQAIISYMKSNFKIGSDVVYSRLYTPINSVTGHQVDSFTIGTSENPTGTSNIVIGYNQIHNITTDNISITR